MIFTSFPFYSVNILTFVAVYCFEMAIISFQEIDNVNSFRMQKSYKKLDELQEQDETRIHQSLSNA